MAVSGTIRREWVAAGSIAQEMHSVPAFAGVLDSNFECLGSVELVLAPAGAIIASSTDQQRAFWVLLQGEALLTKFTEEVCEAPALRPLEIPYAAGETFGEMPILASTTSEFSIRAKVDCRLVRFAEEAFWELMFSCPRVREHVLGTLARRLQAYQSQAVHREKLMSLGTLAAGLMHELNNPGAAALRASSQLRENLRRLQQMSLRLTLTNMTPEQMHCAAALQEEALASRCCTAMGTLEQADAEDRMANWLGEAEVENAWRVAPALISNGLDEERLQCAKNEFLGSSFSDILNWLEALLSSVQLVGTIEESLGRVSDLVMAVKTYAYEGKPGMQSLNVHASLQSTLVILAHKLKSKGLKVEREFAPDLPPLPVVRPGVNQVWTNIIDNAIDASPEGGTIVIRTSLEGDRIAIAIVDHGQGIPEENRPHLFEPFFTTKAQGAGTGLGLEIVKRIAVQQMGGDVQVESRPGQTVFTVRLPYRVADSAEAPAQAVEHAPAR